MSWASMAGSSCGNSKYNLLTDFPSIGGETQSKSSSAFALSAKAEVFVPVMVAPVEVVPVVVSSVEVFVGDGESSVENTPPSSPTDLCYSEKEMGNGIRLGGGIYGPSRVEGRTTITKRTVFKPSDAVSTMMEQMGWIPGMGLGKDLQGRVEPVDTEPKFVRSHIHFEGGRRGIGYI